MEDESKEVGVELQTKYRCRVQLQSVVEFSKSCRVANKARTNGGAPVAAQEQGLTIRRRLNEGQSDVGCNDDADVAGNTELGDKGDG